MLDEFYSKSDKPVISFEVFPPKNSDERLLEELKILKRFKPALVSVTYGAGGSNRDTSFALVKKIKNDLHITPMPHFTCICSSKEYIDNYLEQIENEGIKNILALRGDEPKEIEVCYKDFRYANELVAYIKSKTSLSIGVAGYPEGHSDAQSLDEDIEKLKIKVDAGASVIYTQIFFDNDLYYRFCSKCENAGINIPIIPGILPITDFNQLEKMSSMCNASIPAKLRERFEKYRDNKEATVDLGIEFSTFQVNELLNNNIKGLHIYTLNKSYSAFHILNNVL